MTKKIGILTSGGDCAGLNAAIDAVAIAAGEKGWDTYGIHNGTNGLMGDKPNVELLPKEGLGEVCIRQGGTILGTTNKGDPFAYPMEDGSKKDRTGEIADHVKALGLECIIGIGGDGSLDILSRIASKGGFEIVWIPKTIDNDVPETELAIGFDTAVMKATQALDDLQSTAASHDRVMILEVMGRDAGFIALEAGIAGGADVILIPEIEF
ncbi:MAG: 6-phosphofructokinase, partial [Pseudomonadota bacterium]